jgi:hypothetical protein
MFVAGAVALAVTYVLYHFLEGDEKAGLVWPRDERPPRAT